MGGYNETNDKKPYDCDQTKRRTKIRSKQDKNTDEERKEKQIAIEKFRGTYQKPTLIEMVKDKLREVM